MEKRAKASDSVTEAVAVPDHGEAMRVAEALLFASATPLSADELRARLPEGADVEAILRDLMALYATRGVHLVKVSGRYAFRTAGDLAYVMARDVVEPRRLSRAAMETLAIVAYHQPVTRAEIEEIRGVATSKGTLDTLLETGWVRLRGRRRTPGRPVTYGTTPLFLDQFGLDAVDDLPGLEELKGAGFLEGRVPSGLSVPVPNDDTTLRDDEDPLEDEDLYRPLAAGNADRDEPSNPPPHPEVPTRAGLAGSSRTRSDPGAILRDGLQSSPPQEEAGGSQRKSPGPDVGEGEASDPAGA